MEKQEKKASLYNKPISVLSVLSGYWYLALALSIFIISGTEIFSDNIHQDLYNYRNTMSLFGKETSIGFALEPVLIFYLLVTSFFHFLTQTGAWKDQYFLGIANRFNKLRWIEYSITSAILVTILGALIGIKDISILVVLFALQFATIYLGAKMEEINQSNLNKSNTAWWPYISCIAVGSILYGILTIYFVNEYQNLPLNLIVTFCTTIVTFVLYPTNMILRFLDVGIWKSNNYYELTYLSLSLFIKSFLALTIYLGPFII